MEFFNWLKDNYQDRVDEWLLLLYDSTEEEIQVLYDEFVKMRDEFNKNWATRFKEDF